MPDPAHKERDWIDIGLRAATPLIVGLVIALVGIYGDEALNKLSHRQQSARLITDLQIRREQDESALRKDIFTRALDAFLVKDGKLSDGDGQLSLDDMSKQLLRLELLALNFGDSLSLTPLFVEMHKDLRALRGEQPPRPSVVDAKNLVDLSNSAEWQEWKKWNQWDLLLKRLTSLAKRISSSQLSALAQHGEEKKFNVPLDKWQQRIEEISCEKRTTNYEHKLLYDDRNYSWPHDEVMSQIKPVLVHEVLIPLVLNPLTTMRDSIKEDLSKKQNPALSESLQIIKDSVSKIENYTDEGIYGAKEIDEVYAAVRDAVTPVLEFENAPSDNEKVVKEWKSLISRFSQKDSEHGKQSLWGDIASYIGDDNPDHDDKVNKYSDDILENLKKPYDDKMEGADENEGLKKLVFQGVTRYVEVIVSDVDHCQQSLQVAILLKGEDDEQASPSFRLDYFNFPIVDNTRLAHNHRLAAVIEEFDTTSHFPHIEITLVVFPSEYASLRDRPGMEEVRSQLQSAVEIEPDDKN